MKAAAYAGTRPSFEQWLEQVDARVMKATGGEVHADDLPDWPSADWYEDGVGAAAAATKALKLAGYKAQANRTKATGQTGRVAREKAAAVEAEAKVAELVTEAKANVEGHPIPENEVHPEPDPGDPKMPKNRDKLVAKLNEQGITKEAIEKARDTDELTWADVAATLGLKGSTNARKAYRVLTGRAPTDSQIKGRQAPRSSGGGGGATRRSGSKVLKPEWNDDTNQDEISDAVAGMRITVKRRMGNLEQIKVNTIKGFSGGEKGIPLTLNFHSGNADRAVEVQNIVEVR